MKHTKILFPFIIPLVIMLSSFSIFLIINKVVNNYKLNLINDYSIIISSSKEIDKIDTISGIKISHIDQINRDKIIGDVKDSLSKETISALKEQLPYFSKVYLKSFPTKSELAYLNKELLKLDFVNKVEIFEGEHIKSYSSLILTRDIVVVLFIVILVSSFLMLLQQIKLLFYEYNERIDTLQLLGASLFYTTKFILRFLIISVVISIIVVFILMSIIILNLPLVIQSHTLATIPTLGEMGFESFLIIILAMIIPSIAYFALILKYRNNDNV